MDHHDDQLAALRSRLQRLEDLDAIRRLYVDYGHHLDRGDFASFARLFARDGKLRLSSRSCADGREEIERVMSHNLSGRDNMSVLHLIGAPMIELDGDRARGEAMWAVVVKDDQEQPLLTMVGRHRDELIREDDVWRFWRRRGLLDIPPADRARL